MTDIPTICGDPSLPANPLLRGITPLIDPDVVGADVANALSAATVQNPLDATGKSVADLLQENGFTSLTVQLPDDTTAAIIAQAGGNANAGGQNNNNNGNNDNTNNNNGNDGQNNQENVDQGQQDDAGQGQVVDGNQGQQGNADQCQVNQGQQANNQTGNAGNGNGNNRNNNRAGKGNNRQQASNNRHQNNNGRNQKNGNNRNNNNNNRVQTVTQTVTLVVDQAQAAATVTVTAPCVVDPALTQSAVIVDPAATQTAVVDPAATETPVVVAPPAAGAGGVQQSTIAGLDFGLCVPTMKFEGGVNNRPATEFTFLPIDPLVAQGQQEALNPNIITNRICDQLTNVCNANDAAKAACRQAQANIQALGTRDKATADAWNTELGFAGTVTNPAGGPAEPPAAARSRIMRSVV